MHSGYGDKLLLADRGSISAAVQTHFHLHVLVESKRSSSKSCSITSDTIPAQSTLVYNCSALQNHKSIHCSPTFSVINHKVVVVYVEDRRIVLQWGLSGRCFIVFEMFPVATCRSFQTTLKCTFFDDALNSRNNHTTLYSGAKTCLLAITVSHNVPKISLGI